MNYGFLHKLRTVKIKDLFHFILFFIALPISKIYKKRRPHIWLLCEYAFEARDNAYHFYSYLRKQHPEVDAVYALHPKSPDMWKIVDLGEVVNYGSLKHWIYYLAAEVNISSQKGGKPNAAVCYFLEIYGFLKNKRVFLQHGITKDKTEIFSYSKAKFRLFICGAEPEYSFVLKEFGYPEAYVRYTGFSRYDVLHEKVEQKRQIIVAPTWRAWERTTSSDPYKAGANKRIHNSNYYTSWKEFLLAEDLENILEEYNYHLIFYPHRNVFDCFRDIRLNSSRITIVDYLKYDLQALMKESKIMITDYSSSVMDFAYMQKPVAYYQFDYEEFRSKHFEEGYFNYNRDGFGPVCMSLDEILSAIREIMQRDGTMAFVYQRRVENFFVLRDANNSQRIYDEVIKL